MIILKSPLSEKQVSDELDKLQVSKIQRKIIREKGEIIAKVLEMPPLPIHGFYTLGLVEWQKEIGMTVKASESKTRGNAESRIEEAVQILSHFRRKIERVIKSKGKEPLLNEAISAALTHYIKNYASRPFDKND